MTNAISIRPSKELRTNYSQISALSRKNPVAITVNGKEDTVVLCHEDYVNQILENLAKLDEITYVLTKDAMNAEESVLADRLSAAKDSVSPYLNKGGVVGARANFIAAEVAVQQKNYKDALGYYEAAASKAGKSYLGSILTYNTASCYEMTGDLAKACELFKKAASDEDFLLRAHAQFNVGRICEALGKASDA